MTTREATAKLATYNPKLSIEIVERTFYVANTSPLTEYSVKCGLETKWASLNGDLLDPMVDQMISFFANC